MRAVSDMKTILRLSVMTGLFALVCGGANGQQSNPRNLSPCPTPDYQKNDDLGVSGRVGKWTNCWGRYEGAFSFRKGLVYEGEWNNGDLNGYGTVRKKTGEPYYIGDFKDGKYHGQGLAINGGQKYEGGWNMYQKHGFGIQTNDDGTSYKGEWKGSQYHGRGVLIFENGRRQEGIWENDRFIREEKVNLLALSTGISTSIDRTDIDRERQQLAEERRRLEEEKREREQQRQSQRVNLQITHTQPSAEGNITINVQTGADTASLLINGEEQGGRTSGDYIIKKVARAGQETKFTVIATDINGNKDTKIITVTRKVVESAVKYAQLNPAQVNKQPERDAVAVIIGIAKYESLPIAEFANDDARAFYDYAIRGLGVKPENIKLLVDEGAREAEILKTFRTWLPSRVKSSTEVFVFYSGHGLPTPDGSGLYLLPLHADREVIDDTAIPFAKINDAISMAKPKSVTVILDACYSGQTKAGQTLVASARPLTLKAQSLFFPPNFTVISASQSDQISSSSPDLQHGIFSYYLMKGMEGDADMNKDGKITLGEMRDYLVEQVGRQAAMMSRKQEPQLIGDATRVLVGNR